MLEITFYNLNLTFYYFPFGDKSCPSDKLRMKYFFNVSSVDDSNLPFAILNSFNWIRCGKQNFLIASF
jgi:hypothetical protein